MRRRHSGGDPIKKIFYSLFILLLWLHVQPACAFGKNRYFLKLEKHDSASRQSLGLYLNRIRQSVLIKHLDWPKDFNSPNSKDEQDKLSFPAELDPILNQ